MNRSDSERIAATFESMGAAKTLNQKEADFVIVNMCSVRQTAVDRVYGQSSNIRALKRANKGLKTILTGCILERDKEKMADIFDFVLDKKDLAKWPAIIGSKRVGKKPKDYLEITPVYEGKIQAFVPISNGCDNYCTYCAVPYTRGRLVSRNHKDILKEIKSLVQTGYKEIWLLGENVNSYLSPVNKKIDFAELIIEIDKIEGDFWLRFTSPHPRYFSDKLIKALARSSKFAPYINLPAQSGDNKILRKMNRPYTTESYQGLIKKIRKEFEKERAGLDKVVGISTDIIVGFPGETKAQFNNTVKLMRKVKFDMAFISQYSPRPQSFCHKNLADDVSKADKKKRDKDLTSILKTTALENNKLFLGKVIPVLAYEKKDGYYFGRTRQNKPIRFRSEQGDPVGKFTDVKINKVSPWSLDGRHEKSKLIVIAGPTASGKTDLAIRLAKKFNGEIVSADSRLVYKGMDIATAKPKKDKNKKEYYVKGVRHYLIDILEPNQEFNAALFKEQANTAIDEIIRKGKTPFLVGGTGLYIKAVVDNLDFPKIKPNKKLRLSLEKKGAEELFHIYEKLDEEGSRQIDRNNKRRLVRAIEVCKITGRPFWQERKAQEPVYDSLQLGIKVSKTELDGRIKKRVDAMIKNGLEKEVKKLYRKYGFKLAPMQTIGYQEWKEYFSGKIDKEDVRQKIIQNTISFAKRQITWLKKQSNIKWIKDCRQAEIKIRKFLLTK